MAGWQWLFIVEGLPSVLLAPFALYYLQDQPTDAEWLPPAERKWLIETLAAEKQLIDTREAPGKANSMLHALTNPTVVLMALLYFSNVCLLNSILFFLPQIVKSYGLSVQVVGYVVAFPSLLALAGMIWWGRRSDRKKERIGHAAFANFLAALALLISMLMPEPIIRGVAVSIAFAATLCMAVPFWAIPGSFLTSTSAAGGIAAISAMGVTGGFVAPYFVGTIKGLTGDFKAGFLVIAVFGLVVSALFYIICGRQQRATEMAGNEGDVY